MHAQVVVTGLGVVSAAGVTRDEFFASLASGRSGIVDDAALEKAAPGYGRAARIGEFGVKQHVEPRALRRLARLSQLALVAARQALAQGGIVPGAGMPWPSERIGIVLGTGLGTLKETMDFIAGYQREGAASASPALFPSSVMNAAAGQLALELGLRGVNTTINHREESPIVALAVAADLLALGRADAILVGGVDELSEYSHHGYRRLGGLTRAGMRPYSSGRDGTVLGEGAGVVLLEREPDAAGRGARALARLSGFAAAGEARPRVGFGTSHHQSARVMRDAIADAGLRPSDIDYVAGAGCGLGVDAIEARAAAEVFAGSRGGQAPVPHGSISGQIGESMSAGALRIAAALYALGAQALPGTVGAGDPDPAAPVPGLVREPRPARVRAVLVPAISQGGADAAIVLTAIG